MIISNQIRKIIKFLPRTQLNDGMIVLVHLTNNLGYDLYCFWGNEKNIFLYCETHGRGEDELYYCPYEFLLETNTKIKYHSKMIGKDYKKILNEQYHKSK